MPTPVYLNYTMSISDNANFNGQTVRKISYTPADGEDENTITRNLLKALFVVQKEDGTYDTSVDADFYVGKYDNDGDDFIGFDKPDLRDTIQPVLQQQATDAGFVTKYSSGSGVLVKFTRDANAPADATDHFDKLAAFVSKSETLLRKKGFTQADKNADDIEYSSNYCIVVTNPPNGTDYISIS